MNQTNKKGVKKKRFSIPEYQVDVEFARNLIRILDSRTDKQLNSKDIQERKERLKPETIKQRSYRSFNARSFSGTDYIVNVDFLHQHHIVETEAGYILDIHMLTPYHGFYFGLYEIGEFRVNPSNFQIQIIESYEFKFVRCGLFKDGMLYLGMRKSEGDSSEGPHRYYIAKLVWNSKGEKRKKKILWKEEVPAAVMAIFNHEDMLFIGLKNGDLRVMRLEEDEPKLIFQQELFNHIKTIETVTNIENQQFKHVFLRGAEIARIEYLPVSKKIAVVGGIRERRGDIAIFNTSGEKLLNSHLGDSILLGMVETSKGLYFVNSNGKLYHFQRELTEDSIKRSISTVQMRSEITSNIAAVRDWICGSSPEHLVFLYSQDVKKKSEKYFKDTLARIVVGHDYGVISGDDLGKLRFWKIGDIEVHEDDEYLEDEEDDDY